MKPAREEIKLPAAADKRVTIAAGAAVALLFLAGSFLPPDLSFVPVFWIPLVFAAALAPPLQVAVLAGLCLFLELAYAWLFSLAVAPGLPWRLCAGAFLAALAVLAARRLEAGRREKDRVVQVLLNERRHMADVIDGMDIGMWEWNVQTGETVFNEVWAQIIGYTLAELEPTNIETWMNHVEPADLVRSNEQLQRCFTREVETYECEVRMRHRNGNPIWVLDRGRVVEWTDDGKPLRMLGTHRDITEQVLARELEAKEPRTRLPGVLLAEEQFEAQANRELLRLSESGAKLSLLLVRIDRLAEINADFGRGAGDLALQSLAQVCQQYLRGNDVLARLAGDLLGLLLPDTPLGGAERVANRLVEALAREDLHSADGRPLGVTVSIGAAEARPGHEAWRGLRGRATGALERAKQDGGNKIRLAE